MLEDDVLDAWQGKRNDVPVPFFDLAGIAAQDMEEPEGDILDGKLEKSDAVTIVVDSTPMAEQPEPDVEVGNSDLEMALRNTHGESEKSK